MKRRCELPRTYKREAGNRVTPLVSLLLTVLLAFVVLFMVALISLEIEARLMLTYQVAFIAVEAWIIVLASYGVVRLLRR